MSISSGRPSRSHSQVTPPPLLSAALTPPPKWATLLASATTLALSAAAHAQATYYVSPTGNDLADGLTPATAWRTVDQVSTRTFLPGESILFERGGEWRGRLSASSSGTVEAPILYGAYGSGAKPKFIGSDILDKSSFIPASASGTAMQIAAPVEVGSVLADGAFLRGAAHVTRSADPAVNRAHVLANPGTWWRDDTTQTLLVNTGTNLTSDPRRLTAVTRDDVVFANQRNNLIFRDLAADETAFFDRGYAFRIQETINVRVENSEAFRAGKHHFGVINSDAFVGKDLYAAYAMPDQGNGGATALVSYSDARYSGHTSLWENVVVEGMGAENYPAWVSHGEGIGQLTLRNIEARGVGLSIGEKTAAYDIRVLDSGISVHNGATLDGATLKGLNASIRLGKDAVARNVLIDGYKHTSSYAAAVVIEGPNTVLELSTITMAPNNPGYSAIMAYANSGATLDARGNIFLAPNLMWFCTSITSPAQLDSNYNLFSNAGFALQGSGAVFNLAQWAAATGNDLNSIAGIAAFVDAANGNFNLLPNSAGIDAIPAGTFPGVLVDRNGRLRLVGNGYDIGAFEGFVVVPEPTTALWGGVLAIGLLGRWRTTRKVEG